MKSVKRLFLGFLLLGSMLPPFVISKPVTLVNLIGESTEIDIVESDQFFDVINCIQSFFGTSEFISDSTSKQEHPLIENALAAIPLEFESSQSGFIIRAKKKEKDCYRNYECGYSKQDREDIKKIVTTLARDSLISIASSKSSIEKAGDRIKPVHPLCFLQCIFDDEEMKCGIHGIRDRGGWVGDGFFSGITDTLEEECGRDNLYQFVDDFASKVKIKSILINPSLKQKKWIEFVHLLMDNIPLDNNPNRYGNM